METFLIAKPLFKTSLMTKFEEGNFFPPTQFLPSSKLTSSKFFFQQLSQASQQFPSRQMFFNNNVIPSASAAVSKPSSRQVERKDEQLQTEELPQRRLLITQRLRNNQAQSRLGSFLSLSTNPSPLVASAATLNLSLESANALGILRTPQLKNSIRGRRSTRSAGGDSPFDPLMVSTVHNENRARSRPGLLPSHGPRHGPSFYQLPKLIFSIREYALALKGWVERKSFSGVFQLTQQQSMGFKLDDGSSSKIFNKFCKLSKNLSKKSFENVDKGKF